MPMWGEVMRKMIFGPIPSSRFGNFLGVNPMTPDIVGDKVCNLNCVYCEIGPSKTMPPASGDMPGHPADRVLAEVDGFLKSSHSRIDHIVLVSDGEVTLCGGLGEMISGLRRYKIPVAVISNGARLGRPAIRDALAGADMVMLSLDTAEPDVYKKICRPLFPDMPSATELIEHYAAFGRMFGGELCLMTILAAGLNDRPEHLQSLQKAINRIKPQTVRLSTIGARPSASWAKAVSDKFLLEAAKALDRQVGAEVRAGYEAPSMPTTAAGFLTAIVDFVASRPATYLDIADAFELKARDLNQYLDQLLTEGLIVRKEMPHGSYYTKNTDHK